MPVEKHFIWQRKKAASIKHKGHAEDPCPNSGKPYSKCRCGDCRAYFAKHKHWKGA